jgi:hypothetical protein
MTELFDGFQRPKNVGAFEQEGTSKRNATPQEIVNFLRV